jgi:hypothetical protein
MSQARTPELMYELYLDGPPHTATGMAGLVGVYGTRGSPSWLSVVRRLGTLLGRDVDADILSTS